jgi:4-hydroxybenzoate polyprenyltransferase
LVESFFAYVASTPLSAFKVGSAFVHGKASLKALLADSVQIDAGTLPYDENVLAYIHEAREIGRPVYLASACNERFAKTVAEHLGVFDGVFASNHKTNLSGAAKARTLVDKFGEQGFDYIGDSAADLPVWQGAHSAITIRASASVKRALERGKRDLDVEHIPSDGASFHAWLGLLRVHQYAKNALIFVPLLTAHRFELAALWTEFVAFSAFCLCASSVYILNDLVDIQADRLHPTKRSRPLAQGLISPLTAMLAASVLLIASTGLALSISIPFLGVLAAYFLLTTGYTLLLKRKMIVDVIALASLYTIRIIAGCVAISIELSHWLLIFSIFLFTALALMKRYTELAMRLDRSMEDPTNRNYQRADLSIVGALSAAAGMNAVTVFALYISSDTVQRLYSRPLLLWVVCPLLMYWLGRALMMSHRRLMHDDPIVFALKDKVSLMTATSIGLLMLFAI